MLAELLLAQALLYQPFRVQSPGGFVIEHNGACCTAATVDAAYLETATRWRERAPDMPWAAAAAPALVEVVYYDLQLADRFCYRSVLSAVVPTEPYGLVIVVNAGRITREELPEVLHSGFWRAFLYFSGRTDVVARVDRGCLE